MKTKDSEKIYTCSLHKNYATYTNFDDYLAHMQYEHHIERIKLKDYEK